MKLSRLIPMILILVFAFANAALADDVTDNIKAGVDAYKGKSYGKAIEELNFAIALIMQKQQELLGSVLPKALKGWKAEEAESASAGMAMMGGGSATSKKYTKGKQSVEIQVITNSPMLQTLMMFMSNPMFQQKGQKVVKIKGEKAMKEWKGDSGKISIILDNKILVSIEGDNLSDDKPMMDYANALDFAAIRKSVEN